VKKATLTHIYEEPNDQTIGVLQFFGSSDAVFIMEPGIADEYPRLPDGTYFAKWIHSITYGYTWTIVGAHVSAEPEEWADRNQIRIHSGNDDEESKGCWLPGLTIGWDSRDQEPQVLSSKFAFAKLREWAEGEDFIVEVVSGILLDV